MFLASFPKHFLFFWPIGYLLLDSVCPALPTDFSAFLIFTIFQQATKFVEILVRLIWRCQTNTYFFGYQMTLKRSLSIIPTEL